MSQSYQEMMAESGNVDELNAQLENAKKRKSYKDARFWKPTIDKAGNGEAVIRFLPKTAKDTIYFVETKSHSIEGPNGWFIENCPYTIGLDCPVCARNKKYYSLKEQGDKEAEAIWTNRKAKGTFLYNILVIEDPGNPENNGKNFIWKVPFKVHQKVLEKINPPKSANGKQRVSPKPVLHPINGYNFFLTIKKVAGWVNYDASQFEETPSPIFDGDQAKIQALWESEHYLAEFLNPDKFLPPDELLANYLKKMGESAETSTSTKPVKATGKKAEVEDLTPSDPDEVDDAGTTAAEAAAPDPEPVAPAGKKEDDALARIRAKIAAKNKPA